MRGMNYRNVTTDGSVSGTGSDGLRIEAGLTYMHLFSGRFRLPKDVSSLSISLVLLRFKFFDVPGFLFRARLRIFLGVGCVAVIVRFWPQMLGRSEEIGRGQMS
jgi:hypothetical protein